MTRVYIAGPYSAGNVIDVLDNMRRGMELAHRVLCLGFAPFCPWFDYHFSLVGPTTLEQYYQYSLAWLEVSDAVILIRGWQNSKGTAAEMKRASELGIPVFEYLNELENWAVKREIERLEASPKPFSEEFKARLQTCGSPLTDGSSPQHMNRFWLP